MTAYSGYLDALAVARGVHSPPFAIQRRSPSVNALRTVSWCEHSIRSREACQTLSRCAAGIITRGFSKRKILDNGSSISNS